MSTWSRLIRGETEIDFVGQRRKWMWISVALLSLSLLSLGVRQLNLGIEFVGGLALQSPSSTNADVADVRQAMLDAGLEDVTIQLQSRQGEDSIRMTTSELNTDLENSAIDALAEVTGSDRSEISIEAIGPSFGELVAKRALIALGVFLGVVALFISWRLEFKMALAGLTALFHDLLITVGIYSITGFVVTPATVVAILTILGYSLYDTVVVFDKVEELVEEDDKSPYASIVNRSMNLVLARSLFTSLTSLLPVGSILFVGSVVLGAPTLREFALALFVGIAVGTYSSIFVAAPLLATWKEKEEEWQSRRQKAENRAKTARA